MKTKCVHDGTPPCRGCVRSDEADSCALTHTASARRSRPLGPGDAMTATQAAHDAGHVIARLVDGLEPGVFAQCFSALRLQFPEFGFLHPQDLRWSKDSISEEAQLRILAIITVGSRYLGRQDDYSLVVAAELQHRILALPSLLLIQTFLIMALHAWGVGSGYQAWIYSGIASRMSQVYQPLPSSVGNQDTTPAGSSHMSEVEVRTKWGCFILDKLLSSGKQRPPMMDIREMELRLPASDEAFAFDKQCIPVTYTDMCNDATLRQSHGKLEHGLEIVIRGLDIWSRVHSWVVKGGRKQPGMTDAQNCPWQSTSHWAKLKAELNQWRDEQDDQLKYPETEVTTHVFLGRNGELFGYINLIYYLTTIFLCREFIPFLPRPGAEPCGPIDPPFFPESAPEGWWIRNAHELFDSAARITLLVQDMHKASVPLHTPFSGLCTFTSALMNLYAASFPSLNRPSEEAMRRQLVSENLLHLNEICRQWSIGHEWIHVIDIAHNLFGRFYADRDSFAHKSRDDYVQLESSINLAPLIGLSPSSTREEVRSTGRASGEASRKSDERGGSSGLPSLHTAQPSELRWPTAETEVPGLDNSILEAASAAALEEDQSYLWMVWDDPHLIRWDNSAGFR
ncbi:uncharacterized protein B0I36DRAFT_294947 [Microdochium trichocladiopsis]|uniref:Xylanolytic transcriptional activator regulatory domain-containing protein n=1 Tax=Microdochium trichocladiopsis TaxID=1682393 RepID=A0A9P9BPA7_9PEZI|nr:uncharacterized protein B0I36DRAFT_294947 [Microdochium trichocladiopsis]KAH7024356.1 hypothetical protein B0I36DRAFT_294947 [Microdochium trichocladiopsis]